jgi:hypothetical protein
MTPYRRLLIKWPLLLGIAIALVVFLGSPVFADHISLYTGSLTTASSFPNQDILVGKDGWATGSTISWDVGTIDSLYYYTYTLNVPRKNISHFIIEVSDTFIYANVKLNSPFVGTMADYDAGGTLTSVGYDLRTPAATPETPYWTPGTSNPNMPDDMAGIKINLGSTLSYTFTLLTNKPPVWGDVYAKDGVDGGVVAELWNYGFTSSDTDPDPTNPSYPLGDPVLSHMIVPDTGGGSNEPVPEPGSIIALAGMGITLLIGGGFRRKKRAA